ncbi:MAG TPA: hypothetical protein VHN99_11420 [Deinococcales bacterium]|nr:hypothetical protein [Deinococcales bacterium]
MRTSTLRTSRKLPAGSVGGRMFRRLFSRTRHSEKVEVARFLEFAETLFDPDLFALLPDPPVGAERSHAERAIASSTKHLAVAGMIMLPAFGDVRELQHFWKSEVAPYHRRAVSDVRAGTLHPAALEVSAIDLSQMTKYMASNLFPPGRGAGNEYREILVVGNRQYPEEGYFLHTPYWTLANFQEWLKVDKQAPTVFSVWVAVLLSEMHALLTANMLRNAFLPLQVTLGLPLADLDRFLQPECVNYLRVLALGYVAVQMQKSAGSEGNLKKALAFRQLLQDTYEEDPFSLALRLSSEARTDPVARVNPMRVLLSEAPTDSVLTSILGNAVAEGAAAVVFSGFLQGTQFLGDAAIATSMSYGDLGEFHPPLQFLTH